MFFDFQFQSDRKLCTGGSGGGGPVNKTGQVLVVQEKFGFARFWKLPGGLTDSGEDLADAAVREIHPFQYTIYDCLCKIHHR